MKSFILHFAICILQFAIAARAVAVDTAVGSDDAARDAGVSISHGRMSEQLPHKAVAL